MGIEIERKFLVTSDAYKIGANVSFYRQGYMLNSREKIVRVRVYDGKGALTVKGPTTRVTRAEFEYPIPFEDANEMLNLYCDGAVLEKERYTLEWGGFFWEVDVFHGENEGLLSQKSSWTTNPPTSQNRIRLAGKPF